jgi:hypothetical protein
MNMAKKGTDWGDVALTVLGGLAIGTALVGVGVAAAHQAEALGEEYEQLARQKRKLERKTLTILVQKEYNLVCARMEQIEDILGI